MGMSLHQLNELRQRLVDSISISDFKWFPLELWYKDKSDGQFKKMGTVRVSSPMMKEGYFVPVKWGEMIVKAKQINKSASDENQVFPLTRAVFDLMHNAARTGRRWSQRKSMPYTEPGIKDFVEYSEYLKSRTQYVSQYGHAAVSGAHKLYLLTAHGSKGFGNYGFHILTGTPPDQGKAGIFLKDTDSSVINGLLAGHNAEWWDYSQLLQFMKDFRDVLGNRISLRQALTDGDPAIWDEHVDERTGDVKSDSERWRLKSLPV